MGILGGTKGIIKYDPAGITPVALVNLNGWKLSWKTPKSKVTCFGAVNEVYVPGLPDLSGTVAGFWDSGNVQLFGAARAVVPGLLELTPNSTEPTFKFSGLAYLDADLDCSVDTPPKLAGTWVAAGPWTEAP